MRPYSTDLRERIATAVDRKDGSLRQIAWRFCVSLSFVVRLLQRRRDADTLEPKPHGGGPAPALGPEEQKRLADLIREQPDACTPANGTGPMCRRSAARSAGK